MKNNKSLVTFNAVVIKTLPGTKFEVTEHSTAGTACSRLDVVSMSVVFTDNI